jgi:hypothetical protein
MKKIEFEDFIALSLEEQSLEELLEQFDLSPFEVMWILYNQGQLDDEVIESIKEC